MKKQLDFSYYAVAKGRSTGIFNSWSQCQRQVDGFKHNSFKGFSTLEGAIDFMRKAGIPTEEIDVVEEEGDVLLRKPLSAVMSHHVNNGMTSTTSCAKKGDAVCDASDTESTASRKSPCMLSDTIINELETTLRADSTQPPQDTEHSSCEESDDNTAWNDESVSESFHGSQTDRQMDLNDSMTRLKQLASADDASSANSKTAKPNQSDTAKQQVCSETCKVNPNSRKYYDMTRCTLCVIWFHDICVGLGKDEPIGIWLCPTCRNVPQSVQNEVISLKNDVKNLQESTKSILLAVQGISTKLETCIGGINDRLTSLSNQINIKDRFMTDSLETLSSSTNNIKTVFDQKSNQILNKTSAVLDKLKTQADSVDKTNKQSKTSQKSEVVPENYLSECETSEKNVMTNASQNILKPIKHSSPIVKTTNKNKPINKQTNKQNNSSSRSALQSRHLNTHMDTTTIDLTDSASPKKSINQSTLLVGSSIFKHLKVRELKKNTTVRSFPGATIKTLLTKVRQYNIDKCETISVHVSGNDADQGDDLATFTDNFSSMLDELSTDDRRIIVSGLIPRGSVDLELYNTCLKTLCAEKDIDYIDHYNSFLLASCDIADSYFHRDRVHPNSSGIRKMLKNINAVHGITNSRAGSRPYVPARREIHT